ncbi:MAG: P27 family phage terminase small subunit [Dichotomicrobium sp.]
MSRGPMPKPHELKERQGNPGKEVLVKAPENAPEISSDAPDSVRQDELALAIWEQLRRDLQPHGYVKESDKAALGMLAVYWATWERLAEAVRENGASYVTESQWGTYRRRNPDIGAWLQVGEKMMSLMDRFGLTPAARQRIQMQLAATGRINPESGDAVRDGAKGGEARQGPAGMFAPQLPMGRPN